LHFCIDRIRMCAVRQADRYNWVMPASQSGSTPSLVACFLHDSAHIVCLLGQNHISCCCLMFSFAQLLRSMTLLATTRREKKSPELQTLRILASSTANSHTLCVVQKTVTCYEHQNTCIAINNDIFILGFFILLHVLYQGYWKNRPSQQLFKVFILYFIFCGKV
jgi:hypothetical protein